MESVDRSSGNRRQRIFNKTGLIQGVAVQRDLNIHFVGDRQRAVDGRRRGAPVFMNFQADNACRDLLAQRVRLSRCLCPADRYSPAGCPRPAASARYTTAPAYRWWRGARGRARSAADHGGDAGDQRLFRLLRADPVDMGIDAAGGDDLAFGGNTSVAAPMGIVTSGWISGLPALPIATIRPSLTPMSALTIPQ
jgi:hypothetical protein